MAFRIAIYDINQWALDFDGNTKRILKTIEDAAKSHAAYRAGPELEICGYSLEDAFFEVDTVEHCWDCLAKILSESRRFPYLVIDVGMPVRKDGALYNCRVILFRGRILFIRAKTRLAKDGNYRENRHFDRWDDRCGLVMLELPQCITRILQQRFVLFGSNFTFELPHLCRKITATDTDLSAYFGNLKIGYEICQELWEPDNLSSKLYSNFGCHLVVNGSGSYWEIRKLDRVRTFIKDITARCGGCYAFTNLLGCDGQRYVFYGLSSIFVNGKAVSEARFDLMNDFNPVLYDLDVRHIEQYRAQANIRMTTMPLTRFTRLNNFFDDQSALVDVTGGGPHILFLDENLFNQPVSCLNYELRPRIRFEEEIYLYASLWLWDYLRRSTLKGFIVPLSGGLDSSSVAMIVFCLSNLLFERLDRDPQLVDFLQTKHGLSRNQIKTPQDICGCLLRCVYLATRHSGADTKRRARELSASIGAKFVYYSIDDFYASMRNSRRNVDFDNLNKDEINSRQQNESKLSDDADVESRVSVLNQNLQARIRMVAIYDLSGGDRLVLAAGNVDEALVGYLTKYDCSSGDINPIGGICKNDLRSFLEWCANERFPSQKSIIKEIIKAPPSAELSGEQQRDEDEIGLTYNEIALLGKTRRGEFGCYGPKNVFRHLWTNRMREPFVTGIRCLANGSSTSSTQRTAIELANLVKLFFNRYARNRHKLSVLTPALHAETYSPDDNRFDHRQLLYKSTLDVQYAAIDELVQAIGVSNKMHISDL